MSWYWTFSIITIVIAIIFAIIGWSAKRLKEFETCIPIMIGCVMCCFLCVVYGVCLKISLKNEFIRQTKERQQIIYQIENLTADKDKVKLNEWILTYNDWVNDVNTSKETYGWFSNYYNVDMSEHTIIDLV